MSQRVQTERSKENERAAEPVKKDTQLENSAISGKSSKTGLAIADGLPRVGETAVKSDPVAALKISLLSKLTSTPPEERRKIEQVQQQLEIALDDKRKRDDQTRADELSALRQGLIELLGVESGRSKFAEVEAHLKQQRAKEAASVAPVQMVSVQSADRSSNTAQTPNQTSAISVNPTHAALSTATSVQQQFAQQERVGAASSGKPSSWVDTAVSLMGYGKLALMVGISFTGIGLVPMLLVAVALNAAEKGALVAMNKTTAPQALKSFGVELAIDVFMTVTLGLALGRLALFSWVKLSMNTADNVAKPLTQLRFGGGSVKNGVVHLDELKEGIQQAPAGFIGKLYSFCRRFWAGTNEQLAKQSDDLVKKVINKGDALQSKWASLEIKKISTNPSLGASKALQSQLKDRDDKLNQSKKLGDDNQGASNRDQPTQRLTNDGGIPGLVDPAAAAKKGDVAEAVVNSSQSSNGVGSAGLRDLSDPLLMNQNAPNSREALNPIPTQQQDDERTGLTVAEQPNINQPEDLRPRDIPDEQVNTTLPSETVVQSLPNNSQEQEREQIFRLQSDTAKGVAQPTTELASTEVTKDDPHSPQSFRPLDRERDLLSINSVTTPEEPLPVRQKREDESREFAIQPDLHQRVIARTSTVTTEQSIASGVETAQSNINIVSVGQSVAQQNADKLSSLNAQARLIEQADALRIAQATPIAITTELIGVVATTKTQLARSVATQVPLMVSESLSNHSVDALGSVAPPSIIQSSTQPRSEVGALSNRSERQQVTLASKLRHKESAEQSLRAVAMIEESGVEKAAPAVTDSPIKSDGLVGALELAKGDDLAQRSAQSDDIRVITDAIEALEREMFAIDVFAENGGGGGGESDEDATTLSEGDPKRTRKNTRTKSVSDERMRQFIMQQLILGAFERSKRDRLLQMLRELGISEREYLDFVARLEVEELMRARQDLENESSQQEQEPLAQAHTTSESSAEVDPLSTDSKQSGAERERSELRQTSAPRVNRGELYARLRRGQA